MSRQATEAFIGALERLESERDLEGIARLFTDDCEVGNLTAPEKFHGPDGARQFWTKYRETFDDVRSTFSRIIVGEGSAALEWTTEATGRDGAPIRYDGVSLLDFDGDRVRRFRAYFNAEDLGRQIVRGAGA